MSLTRHLSCGRFPLGLIAIVAAFALLASGAPPVPHEAYEGRWSLVKEESSPVDPWRNLAVEIEVDGTQVTLKHHWSSGRFSSTDSVTLETGGGVNRVPAGRWLENRHLGATIADDAMRRVTARWLDDGRTLQVQSRFPLHTSQGPYSMRILNEYRLSPDRESMALLQLRSSRPHPVHYSFRRAEEQDA